MIFPGLLQNQKFCRGNLAERRRKNELNHFREAVDKIRVLRWARGDQLSVFTPLFWWVSAADV
jgi:hypothetical protein